MQFYEKCIYFILFISNKYLDFQITEKLLSYFESKMIKKYVSKKDISPTVIPTIDADNLTDQNFNLLSDNYRKPVVIKGWLKDSKAVRDWDLDYLKEIIDDFEVNVVKYDSNLILEKMPFNQFVEDIKNSYVNNNHTILYKFPHLFNDLKPEFDGLVSTLSSTNLRNIHIANLFIGYNDGNRTSGSNMHCAGSGNFFCMLQGKKHWTLIDPTYSCLLKGRVAQNGIHGQTLFDMPDTNLNDYPNIFKYLPRYEVTLEPGDVLWNAPWWWHRIRNENGPSIGMAIRNNKVTKLNLQNNLTYTLSGYIYLLYNTLTIEVYERMKLKKDDNFGASKKEDHKDNVLYQIDTLVKKYPKSSKIEEIYKWSQ